MSNPQEPNQPEPNYPGNNPPPVPPGPGYPPQTGGAPQWQQPPSSAAPQPGTPQYAAPGQDPNNQNPYPQGQNPYAQGQNPYPQGQYQPGQYPAGQYGQPPARKSRKVLWIVLSIVAGVIVLAVVGVLLLVNLVGNATSKARSLADEFTTLVVSGQTEQAYDNYLSQPLKDELDKQSFVDGIASLELDSSCKPNYNSVNVNSNNGNNKADLAGKLQCDGKTIDLQYVFEGTNDLKMSSIRLRP
ncbi:hypothetical protein J2Y66_000132 [Paenarthrobacter nitroguajacolicus]|uniref:hypothetical protein n=1 Tax=Paenarthrobacter nitroguajacolicus TaxID=211146 RepID=UPI00285FB03E|nr:hypothetical protein [Paenarthrobacter nitroguajacolicus]MDR6985669.1 hypothetical protein [Paenarthrobacter nitroguajacolicus]